MYSTVSGHYLENDRKGVVHAENLDNMYGTISDYLGNALERNSKCQKQICKIEILSSSNCEFERSLCTIISHLPVTYTLIIDCLLVPYSQRKYISL
jgi:hypothetical protein